MIKYCSGCGVLLQTIDPNKEGYIPEEKIKDSNYCKRCFRLINYNDTNTVDKTTSNNKIIDYVNKSNSFKIYLVDLLNINDYTIDLYNKIKGKKILLISKYDLYKKLFNKNKLLYKLNKIYNLDNLDIISINNEKDINKLINYLKKNNIKKSYLIGLTNSGKSSLINKIIELNNLSLDKVTVSNKINTTLDYINIKVNNSINIIDSPGFILDEYKINKNYKKLIKPITYNMKKDEVLYLDKFYIKFDSPTSITLYTYNVISKKYYKDIDYEYNLSIDTNSDLCIMGLGFINIKNKCNISLHGLDKKIVSIRESLL